MQEKIEKLLNDSISEGSAVGMNCMVCKDGEEIYSGYFGLADRERGVPMQRGTIFRLFSLTKPITAAAAMILTDRGIISPEDKLTKYFPEYSSLKYESESGEILPCDRDMKIEHLLTMTSGLPYANNFNKSVCGAAQLFDRLNARQGTGNDMTTEEFTAQAAEIPLSFQPGERWDYGISADILGGIIERASGMRYSEFLEENIFKPLGMKDTGFYVPAEKRDRFSALYRWESGGFIRDDGNYLGLTDYTQLPAFESGGAGLCSTIEDYSKFAQMLTGRGEYGGVRIMSERAYEFMSAPKLSSEQNKLWDRLIGYNYGCLVRVMTEPEKAIIKSGEGEIGWDGWTGTYFCADPKQALTVLVFTQITGAGTTWQAEKIVQTVYDELVRKK